MSQQLKTCLGIAFASVFSVWSGCIANRREGLTDPGSASGGHWPTPDQYRIAPYLLIGLIRDGISLFVDSDLQLRYSILVFDGFFPVFVSFGAD
jgi:hypothetical protein